MKCEPLPWESELLGKKAGRLVEPETVRDFSPGDYAFLSARLPCGAEESITRLCGLRFTLVETALVFERADASVDFPFDSSVAVESADDADVEAAAKIAGKTFSHSRFHRDPRIPEAVAHRSRSEWVRNAHHQGRGQVIVARVGGGIGGFLVYRETPGSARIDLVGVDPEHKRHGVATALVAGYLARSAGPRHLVSTQATNRESIELYRRTGYRYHDAHYSLHWHR